MPISLQPKDRQTDIQRQQFSRGCDPTSSYHLPTPLLSPTPPQETQTKSVSPHPTPSNTNKSVSAPPAPHTITRTHRITLALALPSDQNRVFAESAAGFELCDGGGLRVWVWVWGGVDDGEGEGEEEGEEEGGVHCEGGWCG